MKPDAEEIKDEVDDRSLMPTKRIENILEASRKRYSHFDFDTKEIASLLNAVHLIAVILDELTTTQITPPDED